MKRTQLNPAKIGNSRKVGKSVALAVLLLLLLLAGVVLAQVSTNFDLGWHLLSGGGGSRDSANYQLDDSLGQWPERPSSSSSYQVEPGFWYGVAGPAATPTATPTGLPTNTPTSTPTSTPEPTATPAAGDDYEIDDTCAEASTIATDGTSQTHAFHDEGDSDWIKFTTEANKTYVIQTSNVGADHDAVLFLYDQCDAASLGSEDNAFGQTVRMEWNSTSATTYYLMLQQYDTAVYGGSTNYDISVTVDSTKPSAPKNPRSAPANQALIIQWKRSPELDVVGYNVWYGTTSGVYGNVEQDFGDATTTYCELDSLTNGTIYYVAIEAVDFSGNVSDRSLEVANIPAPPPDATDPTVTVAQPTSSDAYTTTLASLTISGSALDTGNNLSRVEVHRGGTSLGWDYSLSGGSDTFYVEGVTLAVGDNSLEVTAYDDAGNSDTDTLTVRRLGESLGAVIIVAGHNGPAGSSTGGGLQSNIYNAANNAYQVFRGAGFPKNDIYYLAPAPQDPDGDGNSEVDGDPTPANLQYAVETWAASGGRVGSGKPLFLYMMDHGETEYFCTDGCASSGQTWSYDLDGWLDNLETATGADAINVIIEACRSGSFIDRHADNPQTYSISEAGRVVIVSTGRTNNAYASAQGAYFSDTFFSCVVESNSLKTCYDQAKAAVALTGNNQTPWLDDNGDGLSNPSDGTVAQGRYIASAFGSFRPDIQDVWVSVVAGSGMLTADVERGAEEIDLVWAAVYPPSFQEPTTTTLNLGVPVVLLEVDPDDESLYTAAYPNGFAESGQYDVVFYAQDQAGIHAQPELEIVGEERKVYLPAVLKNYN